MQLTIPNIFANGTTETNIIDAPKVNANFTAGATVLNGNIEADNIKTGSAIAIKNIVQTISAIWTFSANPVFNAEAIADAALTTNIPKKDAANVFTAQQKFSAGIDMDLQQVIKLMSEKVASLPAWESGFKGRILYNLGDNKFYGANDSQWVDLGYIGAYTGGAARAYFTSGIVDDGDLYKAMFKTGGATPTVKILIKGEPYPKRFYTELGSHTHVFTGTTHVHTVNDPMHFHSVTLGWHDHGTTQYSLGTHTHSVSGDTGSHNVSHTHGSVEVGASYTGATAVAHVHPVSLTGAASSAKQAIDAKNLGTVSSANKATELTVVTAVAEGTNALTGVDAGGISSTQKLYGKGLTVKINGTNVTSNILSATGWSAIGDGTGTHAFHTAGTGEMNASAWVTYTAGFHTLEIIEPDSGYGCSILVHIETS